MRYAFLVLLLSACGVIIPAKSIQPERQPVEMMGDFGEETFGKADEVIEDEPKHIKPVHKPAVIGVLPPCKTDSDLEKAIIQKIECLSETANHPALP